VILGLVVSGLFWIILAYFGLRLDLFLHVALVATLVIGWFWWGLYRIMVLGQFE
jgi:hypothetical protein